MDDEKHVSISENVGQTPLDLLAYHYAREHIVSSKQLKKQILLKTFSALLVVPDVLFLFGSAGLHCRFDATGFTSCLHRPNFVQTELYGCCNTSSTCR